MSWAWYPLAWELGQELELSPHEMGVLLAIAEHADANGVCFPSQETLAAYSRASERTVRRVLERFAGEGEHPIDPPLISRKRRFDARGRRTSDLISIKWPKAELGGAE